MFAQPPRLRARRPAHQKIHRRRGRGVLDTLYNIGKTIWDTVGVPLFGQSDAQSPTSPTTTIIAPAGPAPPRASKAPGREGVLPFLLKKVVPVVAQSFLSQSEARQATSLAQEEAETASRLRRREDKNAAKRAVQTRAQESQQRAIEREMERAEITGLARSDRSDAQSRQQAAEFSQMMMRRYPQLFHSFPQYAPLVESQALGALLAPADPTDPLYAQKALGEIEYNLGLAESRIVSTTLPPEAPPAPAQTPSMRLQQLPAARRFRSDTPAARPVAESPTKAKAALDRIKKGLLGSKKGNGRRSSLFGSGLASVFDA